MAKKGDKRAFMFLIYPQDFETDDIWLDAFRSSHRSFWISPLHDRDVKADGSLKVPHRHIIMYFRTARDPQEAREEIQKMFPWAKLSPNENEFVVAELIPMGRYLCHLDDPDKAQYDTSDVIQIGTAIDYQKLCLTVQSDRYRILIAMQHFIIEQGVRSYSQFAIWCSDNNMDWYRLLCDSGTYLIVEFIKSVNYDLKNNLDD